MVNSLWVMMALPASVLIGFAFASIGMACTTYMRSWADFDYIPALTLPLFLFSTTFYPLSTYGDWGWAVRLSPLYHGVALIRAANLGEWSINLVGHTAVLVGLAAVGLIITARRIEKLLLT
jgi:lipooligosaccharide transport system permease protein